MNSYRDKVWTQTGHDLNFIFERDGIGYGIEVKNTLGYLDIGEFLAKIKLARHIGVKPVFAVRVLPRIWTNALIQAGGYAMIMRYQFYPWTHKDVADNIRLTLGLPVDTPKRIEQGTMQRFENWIADYKAAKIDDPKVDMQSVGLGAILVVTVGVERRNRVLRSSSDERATKRAQSL